MQPRTLLNLIPGRRPRLAPSLYDVLPHANAVPRSLPRAEVVAAEAITGTVRHPSNTTADFLPIPQHRTQHWRDNWQRLLQAQEREVPVPLPPIELLRLGCRYFVVDGHRRVAYARRVGAALDAIVVELRPNGPGA